MALAYLCRQLELSSEHSTAGGSFSVTGFVVDHRAREESSREASTVAGWLQDLGMFWRRCDFVGGSLMLELEVGQPFLKLT